MSPHALPRPSHVGLCVSDLDASLRFYCDGLGFDAAERFDLDDTMLPGLGASLEVDAPVRVASQFVRLGDMAIELLHYGEPAVGGTPSTSRGQLGLTHLALHVDDLDASVARAVQHGGTLLDSTRGSLGVELVFLADPDGTRVELMQSPSG
jgi:lactoylglutathione lyase